MYAQCFREVSFCRAFTIGIDVFSTSSWDIWREKLFWSFSPMLHGCWSRHLSVWICLLWVRLDGKKRSFLWRKGGEGKEHLPLVYHSALRKLAMLAHCWAGTSCLRPWRSLPSESSEFSILPWTWNVWCTEITVGDVLEHSAR